MWINKYVKLMFPKRMEDVQMEDAIQLKYDNIPKSLFKYRAIDDYSISNFENDEAWFNTAAEFNDPYDCALTMGDTVKDQMAAILKESILEFNGEFGLGVVKEELENMNFKEMSEFFVGICKKLGGEWEALARITVFYIEKEEKEQLQQMNEKMQKTTKICCFSEINDSILMWSHYANNHKGFCIEYNFTKEGIDRSLTEQLQPVLYQDNLFNIGHYFHENGEKMNPFVTMYNAIVKSTEWSYEKEWRITYVNEKEKGYSKKLFSPQAIYLGAKMSEVEKERMIEMARKKQIEVYQMKMKNNEFKLIPERILL